MICIIAIRPTQNLRVFNIRNIRCRRELDAHVAGTIAALANGEGVVGVLPNGNIGLHIIKVFGASGWSYSSGLVAALDACEAAGSNVVSMSLGGSSRTRVGLSLKPMVAIAAAGNDGNSLMSVAKRFGTSAIACLPAKRPGVAA